MTIEESKLIADDLKSVLKEAKSMGCTKVKYFYNIPLENVEIVVDALEKQIAKKPYIQQVEIDCYEHDCMECPSCDSFLGYATDCKEEHYQDNYCPHCGQALDWKVEE